LALFIAEASIYILIKELATKGLILLAFISFANFNTKVITILESRKLLIILVLLYKNLSKLTLLSFILSLIVKF
jgi:hypothetical protein